MIVGVFDMGPDNMSLWKYLGVKFNQQNRLYFIEHPNDPTRKFYLCPDLVHILKNLTCSLRLNPVLFPQWIVEKFNLSSNQASFEDVRKVYELQNEKVQGKESSFKLAGKLTEEVMKPTQWEKMRESVAYDLISPEVSHAIDLVHNDAGGKKNPTSWYFEILDRLKNIMLNPNGWSVNRKEEYEMDLKFVKFLANEFFPHITIPIRKGFVRSLNGAIVALLSIIEITTQMINEGAQQVFTKNFLNNAVENYFSQTTQRFQKVDSSQFLASLKAISLTHYEVPVHRSSYKHHDQSQQFDKLDYFYFMKEFIQEQEEELTVELQDLNENSNGRDISNEECDEELFANALQEYGFHRQIACIINANAATLRTCDECSASIGLVRVDENYSSLSSLAVELFSLLEYYFRALSKIDNNYENQSDVFSDKFENDFSFNVSKITAFNHCPSLKKKLADDFFKCRMDQIHRRRYLHKINPFSSKGLSSGKSGICNDFPHSRSKAPDES